MKYIAGVDIGGTNTKIGIVNENGKILAKKSIKTLSDRGIQDTMERIWKAIKELLITLNISLDDLEGVGMGIPGAVVNKKIVRFLANFPWDENLHISDIFKKISGKKTRLDNDVNVIALGEAKFGAGKNATSSVTIALGTGIGGGIYIDGNLISGFTGAGGEIGHMKLVKHGKLCGCGQRGCFEAYASATGLKREALSRLLINKNSSIYKNIKGNLNKVDAKNIFDAAKEGDEFALGLVDYEAEYLAMGIGNILNIINPELVVLGGGVALAGDILLDKVREKLPEYAMAVALNDFNIVLGTLGNDAGILGAAALI